MNSTLVTLNLKNCSKLRTKNSMTRLMMSLTMTRRCSMTIPPKTKNYCSWATRKTNSMKTGRNLRTCQRALGEHKAVLLC